jgi:hypothetical protein
MSISIFLPSPINIYITKNTFVRYFSESSEECVGQVVGIHVDMNTITIRRFVTTNQLMQLVPNMKAQFSFWPM